LAAQVRSSSRSPVRSRISSPPRWERPAPAAFGDEPQVGTVRLSAGPGHAFASGECLSAHDDGPSRIPAVCLAESRGGTHVASFIETVIIAAVVSVGIIAVGRAIIRGLSISHRPSHHLVKQIGTTPAPPGAQIPQTCKFRSFRHAISAESGTRFRLKPTGRFGPKRHPV
jgi:hypothetical protein